MRAARDGGIAAPRYPGFPVEWSAVALAVVFMAAQALSRSRTGDDPAASRVGDSSDRLDAGSSRALDGGLALAVGLLAAAMLATWAPHYVTWPWCRDEDTFATLAQSWDAGIRPYRDIRAYNFPGHIYLHWFIGRSLGWGRTVAFYALDVAAVVALGVALLGVEPAAARWIASGAGRHTLPSWGSISASITSMVAERDWHATLGSALALMVLEAWPGRPGLWVAAALAAAALTIRPHAVLFLPAMVSAIAERPRPARALAEWGMALGLFACLGFAPLAAQGTPRRPHPRPPRRGLRRPVQPGHPGGGRLAILGGELRNRLDDRPARVLDPDLAVRRRASARSARTWLLALVAAILYRTLHPVQHAYLAHPLALIGSIAVALPMARVASISWLARPIRGPGRRADPLRGDAASSPFCAPRDSVRALGPLARGVEPAEPPPGCRYRGSCPTMPLRVGRLLRTLDYLRRFDEPGDGDRQRPEAAAVPVLERPGGPALAVPGRVGDLLDVADRPRPRCPVRRGPGGDARLGRRLVAGRGRRRAALEAGAGDGRHPPALSPGGPIRPDRGLEAVARRGPHPAR